MSYVLLVSEQPTTATMDPSGQEKSVQCCQTHHSCDATSGEHRKSWNSSRLRRLILPTALVLLVLITGIFALSCLHDGHLSDWDLDELLARSTSSGGSTSGSSFIKNKLYLVVLIVGLVIVIGLGIMLSFWCCRGSFDNPLCCPCYLCACCGGLVCLECIGCGLCAEALEQA